MAERSMEEIMGSLEHLLDDFDLIARNGHATYRRTPAELLIEHSSRSAACCTYDHMVAEADRRLLSKADIKPLEIRGLKLWMVEHHAVIRFKKMDEDGRGRNYPTPQAKAYDRGEELPGLLPPPPIRLAVGYLADPTQTQVVRVQVSRPIGRSVQWCAAIVPADQREEGKKIWTEVTRRFA